MEKDTSKLVTIPGELHSAATGNIVAGADEIFDYDSSCYQSDINSRWTYEENPEFVEVHTDASSKVLYGVKADGDFHFGAGVPSQVEERVSQVESELGQEIDELQNTIEYYVDASINELGERIDNLESAIDASLAIVDASINRLESFIDDIDSPEFVDVKLDPEGKIVEAIRKDGTKVIGAGMSVGDDIDVNGSVNASGDGKFGGDLEIGGSIEVGGVKMSNSDSPEYLQVTTDSEDKVLEGIKSNGTKVIGGDINVGGSATISGDVTVLGNVELNGASYSVVKNPEYVKALVDAEDKLIIGVKTDGTVYIPVLQNDSIDAQLQEAISKIEKEVDDKLAAFDELMGVFSVTSNPEWLSVTTDAEGKILEGITSEGKKKVMVETEIQGVNVKKALEVFENGYKTTDLMYPDTIIVAASDSSSKDKKIANYICTGSNDEVVINKAIADLTFGGTVQLCYGTYYVDSFDRVQGYLFKHAIGLRDNGNFRHVKIQGNVMGLNVPDSESGFKAPIICVTDSCYNNLDSNTMVAVIGCSLAKEGYNYRNAFSVEDIRIVLPDCTKPVVGISHIHTAIGGCKNVFILNQKTEEYLNNPIPGQHAPTPNPQSVGFYGHPTANSNPYCIYDHCCVEGFAVGFEIGGDHNMLINCWAGRNIIGYSFGYISQCAHHNTLINCSSETDTQFMRFGDNQGLNILEPIQIINFQIEVNPEMAPLGNGLIEDLVDNKKSATEVNPSSQWVGDITYSCAPLNTLFFEKGQGMLFKTRNLRNPLSGPTSNRPSNPNFLEQYLDTDTNQLLTWNNNEWI